MLIKTPMRYHLTPVRMAIIKKTAREFPGSPVVRTWRFHFHSPGFSTWCWGTKILLAVQHGPPPPPKKKQKREKKKKKKRQQITSVGKDVEKKEHSCTVGRIENLCNTMENTMDVPQKIKNRTAIQSRNSTSGCCSEENKNTNLKRYMHPCVY